MPKYNLNALGDVEFERMVQTLLKVIIGPGTTTFGPGRDGAREATYRGKAPFPSETEQWDGNWIFQVKFHDTELLSTSNARNLVIADAKDELQKITQKYKYDVDNYVLITNVPLSGVSKQGTIDRLETEVFSLYRKDIPNLMVVGADDIYGFLNLYPEVRRPYIPLLITGDVIAELLTRVEQTRSERALTIEMYLRTTITREENAQLDQAGDVSEDPIPLQQIFFDLHAYVPSITHEAMYRFREYPAIGRSLPTDESVRVGMVNYLSGPNSPDRIVIVGGPGEGKSTIGQYLAQLHRAALLDADDIPINSDYIPLTPRIPFRIVLKDFAQWLADKSAESDGASLDTYISEQVAKLSTREFHEDDLHQILKGDPIVLILDGLDEVTDTGVRKRLLSRALEFIDRCQNTLHSNIQVIATTRPTNYSDQFDPKTFVHFRLHKLNADQVREYVERWTIARALEEEKADRLKSTIEECLADNQIKLLMTTPLQVTILILIINSGGTPPRQREALFNEYLEVIYKREKAKGLGIVKTEKELLIDLHKFIGYLLHEESTRARTSSATLTRPSYDSLVRRYLRIYDPYSPSEKIEEEWHVITVDAGERLVLIVESPVNIFGFELRSIQEFFAACYLADTSNDTSQRYERFARIISLPYWRNVALFFAGRVGRNYQGEAPYIIEVCKEIDRDGPDLFVKRGAMMALELAAERALGPKRVLQRSLLEHGLGIFDGSISIRTRQEAMELVEHLPPEDIRDHILPILEHRLPTLGYVAIINACYLLQTVAPNSKVLAEHLIRVASETGETYAHSIVDIVSDIEVPSRVRVETIGTLLAAGASPLTVGETLAHGEGSVLYSIVVEFEENALDSSLLQPFASQVAMRLPFEHQANSSAQIPENDFPLAILFRCVETLSSLSTLKSARSRPGSEQFEAVRLEVSSELPEVVRNGSLLDLSSLGKAVWALWFTHLAFGEVTQVSWEAFVAWLDVNPIDRDQSSVWSYLSRQLCPVAMVIDNDPRPRNLNILARDIIDLTGVSGNREWGNRLHALQAELVSLDSRDIQKTSWYGPGILSPQLRDQVLAILDANFAGFLQPLALESLDFPHIRLTQEDFDRQSEWFNSLPPDSPWRGRSFAARFANDILRLNRLRSDQSSVYLSMVTVYMFERLVRDATLYSDDADLEFLLSKAVAIDPSDSLSMRVAGVFVHSDRRRMILRLLAQSQNNNDTVRNAVFIYIIKVCQMASADDGPRPSMRSVVLDSALEKFVTSQDPLERAVGISLYTVRPPRSSKDWFAVQRLLKDATEDEANNYWRWVLPQCAELVSNPPLCVRRLTEVLESGVTKTLAPIIADVLKNVLSRESQSLTPMASELSLPLIDSSST